MRGLPETYRIPDDIAKMWSDLDPKAEVVWPVQAVKSLTNSIDRLCEAGVHLMGVSDSFASRELEVTMSRIAKTATSLIEAQNAMRLTIALVASYQELRRLQTEASRSDD